MAHFDLPFRSLLIYFLVSTKHSRPDFDQSVEEYLPSIIFPDSNPFDVAFHSLAEESIPKTLLTPKFSQKDFGFFLRKFNFNDLDAAIPQDDFKDVIFDSDLRRKLDAMSLSSVFRDADIYREFEEINPIYINIYLTHFANFKNVTRKNEYILRYIGDKDESNLMGLVLKNTSKDYLRTVLEIKTKEVAPKKLIEHALNIVSLRLKSSVLSSDDVGIEKWTKLLVVYAEKLHRSGATSKNDVQDLLNALKADPDYSDPPQLSKNELEEKFENGQIEST